MKNLYDYFIHFNPFTGYWNAVKREHSHHYLNGTLKKDEIIKHKNINDIIRYLSMSKT